MKFLIFSFVVVITFLTLRTANAQQTITYDSLGADSVYLPQTVENPASIKGFANNSNVVLNTSNDFVYAEFYGGGNSPVVFQPGSKIEFYWNRALNDSSKVYLILRHYLADWFNPDGPGDTDIVVQSGVNQQMYTMTVRGSGFNTVEVQKDPTTTSKPVYIDAIVLKQHGTITTTPAAVNAAVAVATDFVCYPNPFVTSQGTSLRSTYAMPATYVVMDLLGRVVATVESSPDAHITVPTGGTYFIRKRVGSDWSGAPLRVLAE